MCFGLWLPVGVLSPFEADDEVCADGLGNAEKVGDAKSGAVYCAR